MSAKLRVAIADLQPGSQTAPKEVLHYLTRVHRLKVGDRFVAFDPLRAHEADGTLAEGETLVIGQLRAPAVVAPRGLTFIQGLAKGEKCDAVVRDATELGATRVIVAECTRSVVQLRGDRREGRVARWTRIASEASRQCGRSDPPRIELAAWDEAIALVEPGTRGFCLHVDASNAPLGPALLEALKDSGTALAFAAGPEGGLTEAEVEFARSRGWQTVSLGRLVLRTETAAAAVLGAVRVFDSNLPS